MVPDKLLNIFLAFTALAFPGRDIVRSGLRSLFLFRRPNMDSLVALGALCTGLAGAHPAEPALLLGAVLAGRALERYGRAHAVRDLQALKDLAPREAHVVVEVQQRFLDSAEKNKPSLRCALDIETVSLRGSNRQQSLLDSVVLVEENGRPLPVDGVVLSGSAWVDESSLSGEPMPRSIFPGSNVAAGTNIVSGRLLVQTERAGADTAVGSLSSLVTTALSRPTKASRLADRIVGRFVWAVVIAAGATASWQLLNRRAKPSRAVRHAASVLVAACPCALGLAAPLATLVALTSAARGLGIRIAGGDVLESSARADIVILDKTGTLTDARSRVVGTTYVAGVVESTAQLLHMAAAVERGSRHPFAKAIVWEAGREAGSLDMEEDERVSGVHEVPGRGVCGMVNGRSVAVGDLVWVLSQGTETTGDETDQARANLPEHMPVSDGSAAAMVHVSVDGRLAGTISLSDSLRPDAAATVRALRALGLRVLLATGDSRDRALAVARDVSIFPGSSKSATGTATTQRTLDVSSDDNLDEGIVCAGMTPEGKVALVQSLQKAGHTVIFVGDGINDTAALATANVGIALAEGADAAHAAADAVLVGGGLTRLALLVELSRRTLHTTRINMLWALSYNAVVLPVAAGVVGPKGNSGLLSPAVSSACMGISSVGILINSLGLKWHIARLARRLCG